MFARSKHAIEFEIAGSECVAMGDSGGSRAVWDSPALHSNWVLAGREAFPWKKFKFLYGTSDSRRQTVGSRLHQLTSGTLMGVKLSIQEHEGWNTDEQGDYNASQSLTDLGHQVADYCEALQHFFHARITSDTHIVIPHMRMCFDLRCFAVPIGSPHGSFQEYMQA